MTYKLTLVSLSSFDVDLRSWKPHSDKDIFISLEIEVGSNDGALGINFFYSTLASKEAISSREVEDTSRMIVIDTQENNYEYQLVENIIIGILDASSRNNWEDSCEELSKHLLWEYEDYQME